MTKIPNVEPGCRTCAFRRGSECRCQPPVYIVDDDGEASAAWPSTGERDWCALHKVDVDRVRQLVADGIVCAACGADQTPEEPCSCELQRRRERAAVSQFRSTGAPRYDR